MKTQAEQFAGDPADRPGLYENPADLAPVGTVIRDCYTVERTLGQGGMGLVVAARHNTLGKLFAIKLLLPEAAASEQFVIRFKREAWAAAQFGGTHVAQVFDVGTLDIGVPYMVMEYLQGNDLKWVLRNGELPVEEAVEYLLQVCFALAPVHAEGIVHRDLKPANLMLTKLPNGKPCIKVLDFGIAKPLEAEGDPTLTRKNEMPGTVPYMSPEQLVPPMVIDHRSDIWALGVVAYELVTAKRPFTGSAAFEIMERILRQQPMAPSMICANVPPAIDAVILKCLQKDRNLRFQSVNELADALREAIAQPHVVAPDMRALMPSMTTESIIAADDVKTVIEHAVTNPVRLHETGRWKMAAAAGGAAASLVTVVGLVVGLRGAVEPAVTTDGGMEPATSASNAVPLVSATNAESGAPRPTELESTPNVSVFAESHGATVSNTETNTARHADRGKTLSATSPSAINSSPIHTSATPSAAPVAETAPSATAQVPQAGSPVPPAAPAKKRNTTSFW